ncbi:DNA-binding transcriptional LysR family regulator [Luteimonas cucumeris]|uniref:DNA-binding transcriptional LysR family regulator n=1 Tax=Luteimonas cucumeris TaxID=985012 RepID=A0A562LEH0_9GAMM|nr:LysR substrate-binding domain-containing protein [Luteimonas cucumeris]TWI06060.1 DNA-binding transcriptional LysR family regulator [Luteimonas cucumeris]
MHLNLHLLRMFQAVVEQQGFSRAAEVLHVSQSAVSKGIRELEYQLDLPLIERSAGRGVRLTDGGQALYEHARGIFAMERAAAEDVRDRVGLRKGRLRVGASTTIAGYWLPTQLAQFTQRHPDIGFELVVGNTAEVGRAVIDCRVDVGFVEGTVDDPRIAATLWKHESLQVAVATASPLGRQRRPSVAELSRQTWLLRESGSGTRQVAQSLLRSRAIAPRRTIEIGSNEAIARAVAAAAGVALLPAVVIADLVAMGRVRTLGMGQDDDIQRPLFRLELADRPRSPALQAFVARMAQED